MVNYILDKQDCIDIRGISKTDFIKIHQLLEDSGNKMYETTKSRKEGWYLHDYKYLKYNGGELCMSVFTSSGKVIPYQEILNLIENKSPTYEIY